VQEFHHSCLRLMGPRIGQFTLHHTSVYKYIRACSHQSVTYTQCRIQRHFLREQWACFPYIYLPSDIVTGSNTDSYRLVWTSSLQFVNAHEIYRVNPKSWTEICVSYCLALVLNMCMWPLAKTFNPCMLIR
jgi:hypothetical protein